jgi:uncharacterized SAM-binding protein YcdF (DUF218 family)
MDGEPDAIVVLGAELRADGGATPALGRRVAHACRLFRERRARQLILVGGYGKRRPPPPVSEAGAMRALALAGGVPADRILLEERSTRTLENAACTARLMVERGWRRALLVTDAFHMPRALYAFRRFGVAVSGDAVRSGTGEPAWRRYGAYAREAAALAGYAWLFWSGRAERIARRVLAGAGGRP